LNDEKPHDHGVDHPEFAYSSGTQALPGGTFYEGLNIGGQTIDKNKPINWRAGCTDADH